MSLDKSIATPVTLSCSKIGYFLLKNSYQEERAVTHPKLPGAHLQRGLLLKFSTKRLFFSNLSAQSILANWLTLRDTL